MVSFAPTITEREQDIIRLAISLLEQTVLAVHGRAVLRLADDAELHLSGEGPNADLGRPGRMHKRVVLIVDRAFYVEGEPGDWTVR